MSVRKAPIVVAGLMLIGACGAKSGKPLDSGSGGDGASVGTSAGGAFGGGGVGVGAGGLGIGGAGNGAANAGVPGTNAGAGVGGGQAGHGGGSGGAGMNAGGGRGSTAGTGVAGALNTAGAGAGVSGSSVGGRSGASGAAGSAMAPADLMPVYRIPLRIHMALSHLTNADLGPVLEEMNRVWLSQAAICFEIEVTDDEANRSDGFDFRYTAGQIPDAPSANGLTEGAHSIWSIDHPNLGSAPHPIMNPAARTTAHELGHALGLSHENPAPSTDCSSPCYCVTLNMNCDDFLLRSGTKGYFLSDPEIQITRMHAAQKTLPDTSPVNCAAPVYNR